MGILPGLQAILMGIDKLEEVIRLQLVSFLIAVAKYLTQII